MTDRQSATDEEVTEMAVTQAADPIFSTPRSREHGEDPVWGDRSGALRLVPGAEALLHPRAAEALVLAFRPL
jgi:hypothetical protein